MKKFMPMSMRKKTSTHRLVMNIANSAGLLGRVEISEGVRIHTSTGVMQAVQKRHANDMLSQ